MKKDLKNSKTSQILFLIISLILLSVSSQAVHSLNMNPLQNYTIEEEQTVTFNIITSDFNGTILITNSPAMGTITKINDSLSSFEWTPSIGDNNTYNFVFTALDDLTVATRTNTILVKKKNNPPTILHYNTTTQNDTLVTIQILTDRESTCKYSLSSKSYAQMEYSFASLNEEKTIHVGKTPTLNEGNYIIYTLCIDSAGNYMTSPLQIPIQINLQPSATISLDPNSPLREGTVKIELTTSEPLINAPELKYYFDDDLTLRPISLVGSGTSWSRYIVIRSSNNERVGTFTFRGRDYSNNEGTKITSGELFLIDNIIPDALQGVTIENRDKSIELTWSKPSNENVKEYKIYKKTDDGDVTNVDYYDSTNDLYFYDNNVEYNTAYYYRVSVVDKAGNEGELSKEVFTTHIPVISKPNTNIITTNTNTQKLDSKLEYILNQELQKIDKIQKDLNKAQETISKQLGTDNIDSIDAIGALTTLTNNQNKINSLKSELDNLRNENLAELEFNTKVNYITTQITTLWKNTPIEIRVLDTSTYQEFTDDEKTSNIVTSYLNEYYKDLSQKDITSSIEVAKKLQDSIVVNVKLLKGEIKYPEETKPFSIVQKTLSTTDSTGKVVIFESIPETVAKVQDVSFSEQPFYKNAYVFWTLDDLTEKKVRYVIYADINMVDLKTVKSIAFIETPLLDSINENSPTGMASEPSGEGASGILLILIIAGVVIICGLFTYYVFWSETEEKEGKQKSNENEFEDQQHKFNVRSILFKKRKETILPDDSHRKLNIDKPEDSIHSNSDSIEFTRVQTTQSPTQNKKQEEILQQVANKEVAKETTKHFANEAKDIDELNRLKNKLNELKQSSKINDLDEFDILRAKTYEIKRLCEELEEQSIIDFTNKTKAHLERSLLYIARNVPPTSTTNTNKSQAVGTNLQDAKIENNENKNETTNISSSLPTPTLNVKAESNLDVKIAPQDKQFILNDGSSIKTIQELKEQLTTMDDNTFNAHVNDSKNDFANWIRDVFQESELAHKIRSAKTKEEIIDLLE